MPKIDRASVPELRGTSYPDPYAAPCLDRLRLRLGAAAGLTDFGVNLLTLPPGAWSSQRHYHSHEDEFVWVLDGEVVLVEDDGEHVLRAGDCAGFKAGVANGHHLINKSDRPALLLEVGSDKPTLDICRYPDCDLVAIGDRYTHLDGTPYPPAARRSAV